MRGSTGRLALERADGRGESSRGGERVCALQLCGGGAHGVRAAAARPGRPAWRRQLDGEPEAGPFSENRFGISACARYHTVTVGETRVTLSMHFFVRAAC